MNTLKTYRHRRHLLDILGEWAIEYACEVGVKSGDYSAEILSRIPSLKKLYLVDLWEKQENSTNKTEARSNRRHLKCLRNTERNIKPWSDKVEILKGYSTEMCHKISDESLDWVYVDARHDYCGCGEDIDAYWPKIKPGGILSGHDYHTAAEGPGDAWFLCMDGSTHPGGVKGAVDEFAENNGLQVLVSYCEAHGRRNRVHRYGSTPYNPTWSILKPE